MIDAILSGIGLKKLSLLAGFFGSLISLKFIDGIATWSLWQRISTVGCGAAVAGYCAPLTVTVLELAPGTEGAIAFIDGLFGMSAAGAIIRAMPEWVSAIRERDRPMKSAIFLGSCGTLAVFSILFVVNKVYNDRVVGRLSLLALAFGSCAFLFDAATGKSVDVPPAAVMIVGAAAVFMAWHYLRFYWRIVDWQKDGKSSNDIQQTVQFNTYADICRHRGSMDITVRLCRNPSHEAANTGIAICHEKVCPDMGKVADGRS